MFQKVKTLFAATLPLLLSLTACSSQLPQGLNAPHPAALSRFSQPLRPVKAQLPAARGERAVTMLSFIAMDDHLSQAGALMIDAMEQSVTERGYYLAFADLQGPDNSFLAYLMNDGKPQQIGSALSYLTPNTKEVDSNDPATLSQTINWAFSNYPGKVKIFDILAHGGGYFGIGTDDHKVSPIPREIMSVNDFGTAVRQGLKGRQFDVMNFLSCLMGNVEALYELRDLAKVVIASEDSVLASQDTVVNFTRELTRLSAQPLSPQQIGAQLVAFADVRNPQHGYYSLAALDMRYMAEFKTSMNVLSNTLIRALPSHKAQILAAYDQVPELLNSPNTGQRDLISFLNNLIRMVPHPAIQQSALSVKQILKKRLMIAAKDKEGPAANGLSIFLPPSKVGPTQMPPDFGVISNTGYFKSRFARETSWDQFIAALLKP